MSIPAGFRRIYPAWQPWVFEMGVDYGSYATISISSVPADSFGDRYLQLHVRGTAQFIPGAGATHQSASPWFNIVELVGGTDPEHRAGAGVSLGPGADTQVFESTSAGALWEPSSTYRLDALWPPDNVMTPAALDFLTTYFPGGVFTHDSNRVIFSNLEFWANWAGPAPVVQGAWKMGLG